MVVEVLLGVDVDIDVLKSDMGSVPGEVDRIVTVELFKESSEVVRPMGSECVFQCQPTALLRALGSAQGG